MIFGCFECPLHKLILQNKYKKFSGYILFCSLAVSASQLMSETVAGSFDDI